MNRAFSTTVDIRNVAPTARPPLVVAAFEALEPGAALELVHDHEPVTVRAALERRAPENFGWETLEAGPQRWRVAVSKLGRHTACCGQCG